jgi:hypothetical protein
MNVFMAILFSLFAPAYFCQAGRASFTTFIYA